MARSGRPSGANRSNSSSSATNRPTKRKLPHSNRTARRCSSEPTCAGLLLHVAAGAGLELQHQAQGRGVAAAYAPQAARVELHHHPAVVLEVLQHGLHERGRGGPAAGPLERHGLAREPQLLDRHDAVDRVQARRLEPHRQAARKQEPRPLGLAVGREHDDARVGAQGVIAHRRGEPVPEVERARHAAAQGHLAVGGGAREQPLACVLAALVQRGHVEPQLEPLAFRERRAAERRLAARKQDLDAEVERRERVAHSSSSRS